MTAGSPARYAIIGDPIVHSLSPAMQTAAFAASEWNATYSALRTDIAGLPALISRFRREAWAGFNATTPLKEALLPLVDELTPEAKRVGGVNVARLDGERIVGHNTDGSGMLDSLAENWPGTLRGVRVLVLGAGPAARAIGIALADAGAIVACWSRTLERARLVGPQPSGLASIVVSALPSDANVPDEILAHIAGDALIADANYHAARSPVPSNVGATRIDGLGMLLHQGARSFEWWTGLPAPLAAMRDALANASGRAARPRAESTSR
ncbi:MAG TPA: shikimate dehydrogenase [Candidatus Eremiobacteraceae bacterium]|nr:shikimate dehydrogenase [Candidatus Eremiobacteraceae bacterium]